jgi:multiple sugar transport system permease protein
MNQRLSISGSASKSPWKWYIFPALFLALIVGVAPLLYSLYISTHQYNLAKTQVAFKFVGLRNYWHLLSDQNFWNSFKLVVIFVVAAVSIELILGTILALLLINDVKGRNIFRSIFLIPMVITPIAVGLMGRFIFDDNIGIVNFLMRKLGMPSVIWYGNPKWALATMIILDVWEWTAFVFILVLAGLMAIPKEYYEAARVEGSNYFGELFKITIPTLRNVFLLAMMIRIIDAFKEFDKIFIMTKGGPNNSTDLITLRNYTIAFKEFNIGMGTAFSVLILIVMIGLGTVLIRTVRRTY